MYSDFKGLYRYLFVNLQLFVSIENTFFRRVMGLLSVSWFLPNFYRQFLFPLLFIPIIILDLMKYSVVLKLDMFSLVYKVVTEG